MCGIAGILNLTCDEPPSEEVVRRMLARIRHRGPDQSGVYLDRKAALGSVRLSILDLASGKQPISNEDDSLWIVFNGEIFNFIELRADLEARGHQFKTHTDTEVLLHLFEDEGPNCLNKLNGQFAVAIWDKKRETLFLARDRLGIRPLFYTRTGGVLIFGSEIKAILADSRAGAEIDPVVLDQIFSFWCPVAPYSIFKNIYQLPPGHFMLVREGKWTTRSYWRLTFPEEATVRAMEGSGRSLDEYLEEFEALLVDATKIRLRADVPVGAYLSGGLDSSTIATIVKRFTTNRLDTFSIAFADPHFDESVHQRRMANFLGTDHHVVQASHEDIGKVFPEVVWHAETPIMRSAPAPMFMLSKLVRDMGYKVVLTGEGADEFLGGYDIFKETMVRRFWARQPDSKWRSRLLQRLYPDVKGLSGTGAPYLAAFFREGLTEVDRPHYSHRIRWRNNHRTKRFFSEFVMETLDKSLHGRSAVENYVEHLPAELNFWGALARAQYLEVDLFLSQYLLCSQGDRMSMAHSVEGRYPFLDYRVVEFCNRLPATMKLRGLTEKFLLKTLSRKWLPEEICRRVKRPYRAPLKRSFFNQENDQFFQEILSQEGLEEGRLFQCKAVAVLLEKVRSGKPFSETDEMALAGILSASLIRKMFLTEPRAIRLKPERL
jgi:asparagine synthase (glutamine-hydrolysing)